LLPVVHVFVNNFHYKRSICRLRISSHRLQIETGRYRNVPRDERICQNCSENEVEDEVAKQITKQK
jgi:superfamily II helicase